MPAVARIHAIEPLSRANGPGTRFVIWFQGCSLACPGCFNPLSHDPRDGEVQGVERLFDRIAATAGIEGVTLSGGEPFQQPEALLALVQSVRQRLPQLSLLVFSGYTHKEILRLPTGPATLACIDVLIAGRYAQTRPHGHGLLGSANQRVHHLTGRYTPDAIRQVPPAEIRIAADGSITVSGIAPPDLAAGFGLHT